MLFLCPSCKKKRWLPAKQRKYWVERIKQFVTSNEKHCYSCKGKMKKIIKTM